MSSMGISAQGIPLCNAYYQFGLLLILVICQTSYFSSLYSILYEGSCIIAWKNREILLLSPVQVYCFDYKEASIICFTSFHPDNHFSVNSTNYCPSFHSPATLYYVIQQAVCNLCSLCTSVTSSTLHYLHILSGAIVRTKPCEPTTYAKDSSTSTVVLIRSYFHFCFVLF